MRARTEAPPGDERKEIMEVVAQVSRLAMVTTSVVALVAIAIVLLG